MKAAWYEKNGAARDVLTVGDLPTPEPGPGEVRVRLHTSGVNPSDVKSRLGRPLTAPRIVPHSDGAGAIDAVGQGVSKARIGERVWTWNGQWKRPFGTAAQFIVLPEQQAVRQPDDVDFAIGACLGIPGLTAVHAATLPGDVDGKPVLVTGAASAVGHYVTQILVARGARVIATASATRAEHARSAGAAAVIDYKSEDVAERIKELTEGRGVDGIVDMDMSTTLPLLASGVLAQHGAMVCYGSNVAGDIPLPFPAMLWGGLTLRVFVVYELTREERAAATDALRDLLERGVLKHTIGARFSLDEIAAAHEAVEDGKVIGNVILDIA